MVVMKCSYVVGAYHTTVLTNMLSVLLPVSVLMLVTYKTTSTSSYYNLLHKWQVNVISSGDVMPFWSSHWFNLKTLHIRTILCMYLLNSSENSNLLKSPSTFKTYLRKFTPRDKHSASCISCQKLRIMFKIMPISLLIIVTFARSLSAVVLLFGSTRRSNYY